MKAIILPMTKHVAAILLMLASLTIASPTVAERALKPAPDFTLSSNLGKNLRLAEQQGNVVMLNFWASWCGPCRQEMPHLNALHQQYSPMGFTLFGVNVDENPRDAERAIKRLKVAFPVLFDSKNDVADLFKVDAMPTTIIIDKSGNIRHLHRGYKPGYEDEYQQQVAQLIRE